MKIAFISQPFDAFIPPSMNSIGIWINEISRRMAQEHEVLVYGRRGIAQRKGIGENVTTNYVFTLPIRWWVRFETKVSSYFPAKRPFYSSALYYPEFILPIALDLRRRKVDIVHLQNFSQFVPVIRAFNPDIKIALHMRCEWLTLLDYEMIDNRLNKVDRIFGVSDFITDAIRERFPQHAGKCDTVYTGIDINTFKPLKNETHQPEHNQEILYVGRITPEKGTHVLLEAFKQVAALFPKVHLNLVGAAQTLPKDRLVELSDEDVIKDLEVFYSNGGYSKYLNKILPDSLQDRVHFVGNVDYGRILDYYQQADILVNPSISEPFGRSLIEGNACGLPVIASQTGGMVELIQPGKNGLLVEPGNADDLAQAMISLLEDDPLLHKMGATGRQFVVDHFAWDKICVDLEKKYQLL
jgi:spore coat protein SA